MKRIECTQYVCRWVWLVLLSKNNPSSTYDVISIHCTNKYTSLSLLYNSTSLTIPRIHHYHFNTWIHHYHILYQVYITIPIYTKYTSLYQVYMTTTIYTTVCITFIIYTSHHHFHYLYKPSALSIFIKVYITIQVYITIIIYTSLHRYLYKSTSLSL